MGFLYYIKEEVRGVFLVYFIGEGMRMGGIKWFSSSRLYFKVSLGFLWG